MKKIKIQSSNVLLLITIVLFFAMYAAGCIVYGDKGFAHFQTFLNILINNAGLICVACGTTMVMLSGGIDISVGSVVAMDCMFLAVGMEKWGRSSVELMIAVLVIGLVFGLVQGFCISYLEIQPFIVTMAGLFFARGMTAVIDKEQVSIVTDKLFTWLSSTKLIIPFGGYINKKNVYIEPFLRISVLVAILCVVITYLILKYTKFGRAIYAVGGNQQSASLMGLNVKKTKLFTHIVASFFASIGGICYCLNTICGTTTQATGLEMDAISSAVIGGTLLTGGVGNIAGTFFGVLSLATIKNIVSSLGLDEAWWTNITVAAMICIFLLVQSLVLSRKNKDSV